jgi:O-antigen ligase
MSTINYDTIETKLKNIKAFELSRILAFDHADSVELRKGYYKQQNMQNMHYMYMFLIGSYVVLFVTACGMLFFHQESNLKKKLITVCALFIMPLLITKLLIIVIYMIQYMKKKLHLLTTNISTQYD